MKFKFKIAGGYSLIELVVGVGLFTAAALMGGGLVLAIVTAQDKAVRIREVQENLSFALETMGREIRMGKSYHCGQSGTDISLTPRDCAPGDPPTAGGGGPSFTFLNALGQTVTYRLSAAPSPQIEKSDDGGLTFLPVTAPGVALEKFRFYVWGSDISDNNQPSVIIILSAKAGDRQTASINLQSTLTQRALDI